MNVILASLFHLSCNLCFQFSCLLEDTWIPPRLGEKGVQTRQNQLHKHVRCIMSDCRGELCPAFSKSSPCGCRWSHQLQVWMDLTAITVSKCNDTHRKHTALFVMDIIVLDTQASPTPLSFACVSLFLNLVGLGV